MNKHIANDIMPHDLQARLVTASNGTIGSLRSSDVFELIDFGFTSGELAEIAGRSESIISRIDAGEPLTSVEYESLQRLIRFKLHALRVFGNKQKAMLWTRNQCRALADAIPIELLISEAGAQIVEEELFRIEHGIYF